MEYFGYTEKKVLEFSGDMKIYPTEKSNSPRVIPSGNMFF